MRDTRSSSLHSAPVDDTPAQQITETAQPPPPATNNTTEMTRPRSQSTETTATATAVSKTRGCSHKDKDQSHSTTYTIQGLCLLRDWTLILLKLLCDIERLCTVVLDIAVAEFTTA